MLSLSDRDKGPYYLLRARALRMKKDFKEARKEISKTLALNSEDPAAHLALAGLLCDQGSWGDASAEFENAITGFQNTLNPQGESEALVLMVACSDALKGGADGEVLLKKAVEKDKFNADAYFALGKIFKADKKTQEDATTLFDVYLKLAPNGVHAAEAKALR
jgi:Tfp pilus assembly protein PilF